MATKEGDIMKLRLWRPATSKETCKLLERAGELLAKPGVWTKGDLQWRRRFSDGSATCQHCLLGAVYAAAGTPQSYHGQPRRVRRAVIALARQITGRPIKSYNDAYVKVYQFNDTQRSVKPVLNLLDKTKETEKCNAG
jgi:hypothetical protein